MIVSIVTFTLSAYKMQCGNNTYCKMLLCTLVKRLNNSDNTIIKCINNSWILIFDNGVHGTIYYICVASLQKGPHVPKKMK